MVERRESSNAWTSASEDGFKPTRLTNWQLEQNSFDKIKVQLVALKLIEKSRKKHGVHDKSTYWSLTPYGEHYVMRLKAERR